MERVSVFTPMDQNCPQTAPGGFGYAGLLKGMYASLGAGWRGVAERIGAYSPAYWCSIAGGKLKPSKRAERALRKALGLPPPIKAGRWRGLFAAPDEWICWAMEKRYELVIGTDGGIACALPCT